MMASSFIKKKAGGDQPERSYMTNIPNDPQHWQEDINILEQGASPSESNLDNSIEPSVKIVPAVQNNNTKQQAKKNPDLKEQSPEKKLEADREHWNTSTKQVILLIDDLLKNPKISELFDNPSMIKDKLSQRDLHKKLLYIAELDIKNKNESLEILTKFLELRENCKKLFEQWKGLWPEDWNIINMNQRHGAILLDSLNIICEEHDPISGKIDFKLVSKKGFTDFYENKCFIDSRGNPRNKAKHWLSNPERREYGKIVFKPGADRSLLEKYGEYNTFRGLAFKPKEGDCSLFKEHIKNIICSGNQKFFEYIWQWMASIVQHTKPGKIRTAIVLMGDQGTGKNQFAEIFGSIFGQHYIQISSLHELTSNFNAQFENALLIHAAEALWGGNKQEVGKVKALITDAKITIERKGKDSYSVDNYINIIFTSNEDWPVALDKDDRRYFVLKVSADQRNNTDYFGKLLDQMDNGGREALLYELQQVDLKNFNITKIPSTREKFDLKMLNQDSIALYLYYAVLVENQLELQEKEGISLDNASAYEKYKSWCENNEYKPSASNAFGRKLREIIPSIPNNKKVAVQGRRIKAYEFPSLSQCKKEFRAYFKIDDSLDIFEE
jgi:hypothetical protein